MKGGGGVKQRIYGIMPQATPVYNLSFILERGTLGARDFSSAVSGFCQVFIVTRTKSFSRGFAARGFGARKTTGTQGRKGVACYTAVFSDVEGW